MQTPSWTVGDTTVHRIDETLLPPATGPWLLPGATPEVVTRQDWLRPDFADDDGVLRLGSHSFALTTGDCGSSSTPASATARRAPTRPGTTCAPTTRCASPRRASRRTPSTW